MNTLILLILFVFLFAIIIGKYIHYRMRRRGPLLELNNEDYQMLDGS